MNFNRTYVIVIVALTLLTMGCATSQQRAEQNVATQKATASVLIAIAMCKILHVKWQRNEEFLLPLQQI